MQKILVIGCGYIGVSTILHFVKAGDYVVGIDIDESKIEMLRKGELPQKDLLEWLDFDPKPLLKRTIFCYNFENLKAINFDVIFIAIPTEKDGEPYFKALNAVIKQIANSPNKNTLIIVESTLMPGVSDEHIKPYLPNFAICPRRDWFGEKDKNLTILPRIVGGNTKKNTDKAKEILNKVCRFLHICNYKEAELVKAVENSLRHIGCVYAQELSLSYPSLDIRKVLKLASTKYNVPFYYPAISTGGYCIPLSSRYVIKGAKNGDYLHIAKNAIITDNYMPQIIVDIIEKRKLNSIGILGIAYLKNIKVNILSSGMRVISCFKEKSKIKVNDPLYSNEELRQSTECEFFNVPEDLNKVDAIMLLAGHTYYSKIDKKLLIEKTKNLKFIFDNTGIWEGIDFKCPYSLIGTAGWLEKIK